MFKNIRTIAPLLFVFVYSLTQSAAAEDAWRVEARQRIDQIRKSDFMVRVRDAGGKPLSGVTVHIEMVRHAFPWGSCVQAERLLGQNPDDMRYTEKLKELFNCATLENELKWNAWHGAYGPSFTPEKTRAALTWLKEHQFRIRGHCMVWPGWDYLQPSGREMRDDLPKLRESLLAHIGILADFTREYVYEWDVVNEPIHQNEVLRALDDNAIVEWFTRARAALPESCRLFINEYNIVEPGSILQRDKYEKIISGLLDRKAPLEGIGFQSHFHEPPESPVEALEVFDRFARFGLPMVVTEFDVNTKDEARQAQFTGDFMTAAFSHPACGGFVFWGFWEDAHWRSDAALFRKDWSEKPNLGVYRNLVFSEWWTDETGKTNEKGEFALRAFKGTYRLTVGDQEKMIEIGDSAAKVEMML